MADKQEKQIASVDEFFIEKLKSFEFNKIADDVLFLCYLLASCEELKWEMSMKENKLVFTNNLISMCYDSNRHYSTQELIDMLQHKETEEYKKIGGIVHHLVPSASFVGMLLQSAPGTRFIKNKAVWLKQHSPFTWEVGEEDFDYEPGWDINAKNRIVAVNSWLADQSYEERKSFTEMLYHIASSSGAGNIFRPGSSWATKMSRILEATRAVDAKARGRLIETLKLMVLLSIRARG